MACRLSGAGTVVGLQVAWGLTLNNPSGHAGSAATTRSWSYLWLPASQASPTASSSTFILRWTLTTSGVKRSVQVSPKQRTTSLNVARQALAGVSSIRAVLLCYHGPFVPRLTLPS